VALVRVEVAFDTVATVKVRTEAALGVPAVVVAGVIHVGVPMVAAAFVFHEMVLVVASTDVLRVEVPTVIVADEFLTKLVANCHNFTKDIIDYFTISTNADSVPNSNTLAVGNSGSDATVSITLATTTSADTTQ